MLAGDRPPVEVQSAADVLAPVIDARGQLGGASAHLEQVAVDLEAGLRKPRGEVEVLVADQLRQHLVGERVGGPGVKGLVAEPGARSEEHTSELQSLMRISSAVFCMKKK